MQPDQPGTDVANRTSSSRVPVQLGIRITDLDTAWRAAQAIAVSNLCPRDLQGKPADCLMILMYGSELGLSIIQSVQGIHPINGRITLATETRVSLANREGFLTGVACGRVVAKDGDQIVRCGEFAHNPIHRAGGDKFDHWYQGDHTLERCRYRVENPRTGMITFGEFTLEDALTAHLLTRAPDGKLIARSGSGKPTPWELYGRDMLLNRAAARACRAGAPETGIGLYTEEEVEAFDPPPDPLPAAVTVTPGGDGTPPPDPDQVAADVAALNVDLFAEDD